MSSRPVQRAVIEFLTAWQLAVAQMPETPAELPADLQAALGGLGHEAPTVDLGYVPDLVPLTDVRRLVAETITQVQTAMEAHYGQVIGYMAFLFSDLARAAPLAGPDFDLAEFLQRQALIAAMDDEPDSDPRP